MSKAKKQMAGDAGAAAEGAEAGAPVAGALPGVDDAPEAKSVEGGGGGAPSPEGAPGAGGAAGQPELKLAGTAADAAGDAPVDTVDGLRAVIASKDEELANLRVELNKAINKEAMAIQEIMGEARSLTPNEIEAVRLKVASVSGGGEAVSAVEVASLLKTLDVVKAAATASTDDGLKAHCRDLERALMAAVGQNAGLPGQPRGAKGTAPALTREQFDKIIKDDCDAIAAEGVALAKAQEAVRALLPVNPAEPEVAGSGELEKLEEALGSVADPDELCRVMRDAMEEGRQRAEESAYRQLKRVAVAEMECAMARDLRQHGAPLIERARKRLEFLRSEREKKSQAQNAAALVAAAGR